MNKYEITLQKSLKETKTTTTTKHAEKNIFLVKNNRGSIKG